MARISRGQLAFRALLQEPFLQLPTILAEIFGLREAITIQIINNWCLYNRTHDNQFYYRDGHWWTSFTCKYLSEHYPWMGNRLKFQKLISSLEKQNIIVSGNYNQTKMNQTKWYRINEEQIGDLYEKLIESKPPSLQVIPPKNPDEDEPPFNPGLHGFYPPINNRVLNFADCSPGSNDCSFLNNGQFSQASHCSTENNQLFTQEHSDLLDKEYINNKRPPIVPQWGTHDGTGSSSNFFQGDFTTLNTPVLSQEKPDLETPATNQSLNQFAPACSVIEIEIIQDDTGQPPDKSNSEPPKTDGQANTHKRDSKPFKAQRTSHGGDASLPPVSSKMSDSEYEIFRERWNEIKASHWGKCQIIDKKRLGLLKKLYFEYGDRTMETFERAIAVAKKDRFWGSSDKKFTIDNILRHVTELSERFAEDNQEDPAKDPVIEQMNERYREILQNLEEFNGGFGF